MGKRRPGRPKTIVNPNIGKRLKLIRKHLGITQPEFAECYEVSEQSIRNWENGIFTVPDRVLEDLSERLSIDIRFLECKTDIPNYDDVLKKFDEKYDSKQLSIEVKLYETFIKYIELLGHDISNITGEELSQIENGVRDFANFKINQIKNNPLATNARGERKD